MVTAQQLAEARAYERRRVVTAFMTGSAPERAISQPSTGRALLGGLALAVLLSVALVVWSVARAGDGQSGDAALQQRAVAQDRAHHLQGVRLRTDADR